MAGITATGQVSVGTTPTQIVAARGERVGLVIQNAGDTRRPSHCRPAQTQSTKSLGKSGSACYEQAMKTYCNLAYSALACLRIGMSGSASFHKVRKSL